MVKIDKGAGPRETTDKNDELVEDLKTVYKLLAKLYMRRNENRPDRRLHPGRQSLAGNCSGSWL